MRSGRGPAFGRIRASAPETRGQRWWIALGLALVVVLAGPLGVSLQQPLGHAQESADRFTPEDDDLDEGVAAPAATVSRPRADAGAALGLRLRPARPTGRLPLSRGDPGPGRQPGSLILSPDSSLLSPLDARLRPIDSLTAGPIAVACSRGGSQPGVQRPPPPAPSRPL
jgi:hypothetical protein